MTDEQKLERINKILDVIIEVYFRLGELPFETAYAWAISARAHVEDLRGLEGAAELVENLDAHPDCYRIIFPANEALEKHVLGLFSLRGVLGDSTDSRNKVMFVREGREGCETPMDEKPHLWLVPPSV